MKTPRVHACRLLLCLLWLFVCGSVRAAETNLEMEAPAGWTAEPLDKGGEFPLAEFKAPGGRDAVLMVWQVTRGKEKLPEEATLEDFHVRWFAKMFGAEPDRANRTKFKSDHGEFCMSVYTDPALVGKPMVRGDYKYAVQITGLIDQRYYVHCGILLQEQQGLDLDEAKTAVSALHAK